MISSSFMQPDRVQEEGADIQMQENQHVKVVNVWIWFPEAKQIKEYTE